MKKISNIILVLVLCACLALPFAGCNTYQNSENCGGIVKGYECIGEKEIKVPFTEDEYFVAIQIEITFKNNINTFYPFLSIVNSFFEDYNCLTIDELFSNQDFIDTYSNVGVLEVENGKAIFEINTAFQSNTSVYFYEGIKENNVPVKIEDFSNYIGYFKYN